jgi:isoquinoline 1-oxidoreductase subunit beta
VFAADQADLAKPIALNAWLKIGTDDTVTIAVSQAEMGQGISTTLPRFWPMNSALIGRA